MCWPSCSGWQRCLIERPRCAWCDTGRVTRTLGFLNVALDHMLSDVVKGKGRGGGGEAYLTEANLLRRLRGRGLPIVNLEISASARKDVA